MAIPAENVLGTVLPPIQWSPKTADDAKITAHYAHGVLEIKSPKKEASH